MSRHTAALAALILSFFVQGLAQAGAANFAGSYTFSEVHDKSESRCDICHPPTINVENAGHFLKSDLCLSCHEDKVVMMSDSRLRSAVSAMNNHPIKISPLDYNRSDISRFMYSDGKRFWMVGPYGSLPLFGESRKTAVIECATCHDPHGGKDIPKLNRINNRGSRLCMVCHIK